MPDAVTVLPEPALEFRHGQAVVDPHDGLSLFGPFDTDSPTHPSSISYGLVGTASGVAAFLGFSEALRSPIHPDNKDPRLWPLFPGFEAAFSCRWPVRPSKCFELDAKELDHASRDLDPNKRAADLVDLYLTQIKRMYDADEHVHVIVCVVPEAVYSRCRPLSRIPREEGVGDPISARQRTSRAKGQRELFRTFDPTIYQLSVDFRRQLKARCMEFEIPIQIVRDSTLRLGPPESFGDRDLTPLSDRAWNLGVALYYKAGGKPWRLKSAREGVCYIGLAYRRRDTTSKSPVAACAAQMFLDSGDGIVFMGKYGPWFSPKFGSFHLTKESARELLEGTLKTYEDLEGLPLKEIFLHCRSGINREEFTGFEQACPKDVKVVGVRVRPEAQQVRLLREGTRPVLRGTFWPVNQRSGYLWATGFKPRLATYDGWETPVPLRIDVQHGSADIGQVAQDILGLTKLNYNACRIGEKQPVTVKFSDAVGEILISNPAAQHRSPKFRFYV